MPLAANLNRSCQVVQLVLFLRPSRRTSQWPRDGSRRRTPRGWGAAYLGDAAEVLTHFADESVSLVFTSPPFALRRKKAYGNVTAEDYIQWFWPIVEQIQRVLRSDGSFVMELGGAWNRGGHTVAVSV